MPDLRPIIFDPVEHSCHDATLDQQHRRITLLLNQLIGIRNLDDRGSLRDTAQEGLLELARALSGHFSRESEYLSKLRYPRLGAEVLEFDRMRLTLSRGIIWVLEYGREELHDLLDLLCRMWREHLGERVPQYRFYESMARGAR